MKASDMKVASWNVNGIRASTKNGFLTWFQSAPFDCIGLQEVRAEESQIPSELLSIPGWHSYWHPCARKKGYSGVGVLSRHPAKSVIREIGVPDIDEEGRIIAVELDRLWFVSIYFPNSGESCARLPYKLHFCQHLHQWATDLRFKSQKPVVLCGDYNIAHQPIDLARPKDNEATAGYLPEERAWMTEFLNSGWVDTFRERYPDKKDAYSWWSLRQRARERNVGWRIDYHCVHANDRGLIVDAAIQPAIVGSDHCPVTLELKL
jgi:exodeoxyribonuclease-3